MLMFFIFLVLALLLLLGPNSTNACVSFGSSLCFVHVLAGFSPLARMHTHFFFLHHFGTHSGGQRTKRAYGVMTAISRR